MKLTIKHRDTFVSFVLGLTEVVFVAELFTRYDMQESVTADKIQQHFKYFIFNRPV